MIATCNATGVARTSGVVVWLLFLLLPGPSAGTPAGQPATRPAASPKPLLIVAPLRFHDSLQQFLAFKRQEMRTDIVALENVLRRTEGVDDPERLKRFLYARWRQDDIGYVLLVGDADVLPVRFIVGDRRVPEAFNYSFGPTDWYYADLAEPDGSFDDWNAVTDDFHARYFGEMRGEYNKSDPINYDRISYLPEISVGRWPVSTPEQVLTVAKKTIRHQQIVLKDADPALRRAAFVCTGGWFDARGTLDRLAQSVPPGWSAERRYYHDDKRSDVEPANEKEVYGLLNAGVGLFVHVGHGTGDALGNCLRVRNLGRVQNSGRLPVVLSIGCTTANFANGGPYVPYVDVDGKFHPGTNDKKEVFTAPPPPPAPYQRGNCLPWSLGKQMLRLGPSGAVAYIGSNTGAQPCALSLLEGFSVALGKSDAPRLGDCWNTTVRHYHDKHRIPQIKPDAGWYPVAIYGQPLKFMVFGDPSLRLPTPRGTGEK